MTATPSLGSLRPTRALTSSSTLARAPDCRTVAREKSPAVSMPEWGVRSENKSAEASRKCLITTAIYIQSTRISDR